MANVIDFIIQLGANQQNLRQVRSEIQNQLKNINVEVNPNVRRALSSRRGGAASISGANQQVQAEITKITSELGKLEQSLGRSLAKRAQVTARIAELESSSASLTSEQNAELKRLRNSEKGLVQRIVGVSDTFLSLSQLANNLGQAITAATTAVASSEKIRQIGPGFATQSQQELNSVNDRLVAATREQIEAVERRAAAEKAVADFTQARTSFTRQDNEVLQQLVLERNSSIAAEQRLNVEIKELTSRSEVLNSALQSLQGATLETTAQFEQIQSGAVGSALQAIDSVVQRVASDFLQTGREAVNVQAGISQIEAAFTFAGKTFRELGFTAEQQGDLLQAAISEFKDKISGTELIPAGLGFDDNVVTSVEKELRKLGTDIASTTERMRRLRNATRNSSNKIGENIEFTGQAANANKQFVRILRDSFDSGEKLNFALDYSGKAVATLSQPIEAVSKRATELSIRFGAVGNVLRKEVEGAARFLNISINQAADEFGNDLKAVVAALIPDGDDSAKAQEERTRVLRLATEALKREQAAEVELLKNSRDLAKTRGAASKERQKVGAKSLDDIDKDQRLRAKLQKDLVAIERKIIDANRRILSSAESDAILQQQSAGAVNVNALKSTFQQLNLRRTAASIRSSLIEIDREISSQKGIIAKSNSEAAKIASSFRTVDQKIKDSFPLAQKRLDAEQKIGTLTNQRESLQKQLLAAESEELSLQRKRNRSVADFIRSRVSSAVSGDKGPAGVQQLRGIGDIASFGQSLDSSGQEAFIKALKQEGANLSKVNTQLKAHQGNIAKSNVLVDRMTVSMTAGQKAAFQFGFAASNAAERLLAWASPALFIFQAIGLLREAVSQVIKLDDSVRRIAFFQPDTLDAIAAGFTDISDRSEKLANSGRSVAGSFASLNTQLEKQNVIQKAAAETQKILIARSKETGIAIDDLVAASTELARIGEAPFTIGGDATEILRAVELFQRFDTAASDAGTSVRLINGVIKQFGENSADATSVVALLAQASSNTSFAATELAEVLTRTGSAFNQLQSADLQKSLGFVEVVAKQLATSVGRTATSIERVLVNTVEAADEIERFSKIKIVNEDGLTNLDNLVDALVFLGDLDPGAAVEFESLFADKKVAARVLALAKAGDELKKRFSDLERPGARLNEVIAAQNKLLAEDAVIADGVTASVNRFRASLAALVSDAGVEEFSKGVVDAGTSTVDAVNSLSQAIGGIGNAFKALAGIAIPTLLTIGKGFTAGLVQRQTQVRVTEQIIALSKQELGTIGILNKLEANRILNGKQIRDFRAQAFKIVQSTVKLRQEEALIEAKLAAARASTIPQKKLIEQLEAKGVALQSRKVKLIAEEAALNNQIISQNSKLLSTSTGFAKRNIGGLALGAGLIFSDEIASVVSAGAQAAFDDKSTAKKAGDVFQTVVEGALTGAIAGSFIPGVGTALGAVAGAGAGVISEIVSGTAEASANAKLEAEARKESLRATQRDARLLREKIDAEQQLNDSRSKTEIELINAQFRLQELEIQRRAVAGDTVKIKEIDNQIEKTKKDLISAQLRLRERENAVLEEKIAFEKDLIKIASAQTRQQKALDIARSAQIFLAQRQTDSAFAEAKIDLKFNLADIESQRLSLQKELDRRSVEISSLRADTGNKDEIRAISKEREALAEKIKQLTIDELRIRNEAAIREINVRDEAAKENLDLLRKANDEFVSSLDAVISAQDEVVNLIGRESDLLGKISAASGDLFAAKLQDALSTIQGDDKIERIASQQRVLLQSQLAEVEKSFNKQIGTIGEVLDAGQLVSETEELAQKFIEFNNSLDSGKQGLTLEQQLRKEILEKEKENLEIRAKQSKKVVELEISQLDKLNQIRKQEIDSIQKLIEAQRVRARKEAEAAEQLIRAPEEFIKRARDFFTAKDFLAGINPDNALDELEKRIRLVQQGKFGGPQQVLTSILEGLSSAVDRNVKLLAGFSPEDLREAFLRLQTNSAEDIRAQLAKEQNLANAALKKNEEILNAALEQKNLLESLRNIAKADESSQKQFLLIANANASNLKKIADESIKTAAKTREALTPFIEQNANLINSLPDELKNVFNSPTRLQQEKDNQKAHQDTVALLKELVAIQAIPESRREIIDELRRTFEELSRGLIPEESRPELERRVNAALTAPGRRPELKEAQGELQRLRDELFRQTSAGLAPSAGFGNASEIQKQIESLEEEIAKLSKQETIKAEDEFRNKLLEDITKQISELPAPIRESIAQAGTRQEDIALANGLLLEKIADERQEFDRLVRDTVNNTSVEDEIFPFTPDRFRPEGDESGVFGPEPPVSDFNKLIDGLTKTLQIIESSRAELPADSSQEKIFAANQRLFEEFAVAVRVLAEKTSQEQSELVRNLQELFSSKEVVTTQQDAVDISEVVSSDKFVQVFNEVFDAGAARFAEKIENAANKGLKLDIGEISVQLESLIRQELRGEQFVQQLTEALQGTPLEDRVETIQGIIQKLVTLEITRGGVGEFSAEQIDSLLPQGGIGDR